MANQNDYIDGHNLEDEVLDIEWELIMEKVREMRAKRVVGRGMRQ